MHTLEALEDSAAVRGAAEAGRAVGGRSGAGGGRGRGLCRFGYYSDCGERRQDGECYLCIRWRGCLRGRSWVLGPRDGQAHEGGEDEEARERLHDGGGWVSTSCQRARSGVQEATG